MSMTQDPKGIMDPTEMSHGPDAWALGFAILTEIFIIPPNNDSLDVFTDKFKKPRTRMVFLKNNCSK
jgi:hypothetical protein